MNPQSSSVTVSPNAAGVSGCDEPDLSKSHNPSPFDGVHSASLASVNQSRKHTMPTRTATAPAAHVDPRFGFAYVGNPTDAAGRRKALVENDALTIGSDHVFVKLLPDALDHDTWKPEIGVPVYALHLIFLGGSIMDNSCFTQGVFMLIKNYEQRL